MSHLYIYTYSGYRFDRTLFVADAAERGNDFIKLHLPSNFNSGLVASLFALETWKDGRSSLLKPQFFWVFLFM